MSQNEIASPLAIPSYLIDCMLDTGEVKTGELMASNSDSAEPDWQLIDRCFQADYTAQVVSTLARVMAGFELKRIKVSLGHGNYLKELDARGLSRTTSERCVKVATMFSKLDISKTAAVTLLELDFTKLLKIQQWEDNEIQDFAEGKTVKGLSIDEVREISKRDLERKIQESDACISKLEKQIEERNKIIQQKDAQLALANKLTLHNGQPAIINNMRTLSVTLTAEILRLLDMLGDLEITLAKGVESGLSMESEKRVEQLRAGLTPWTINLNVIQARTQQINDRAREHFAADLFPKTAEDVQQLSELECISAHSHYAFKLLTKSQPVLRAEPSLYSINGLFEFKGSK